MILRTAVDVLLLAHAVPAGAPPKHDSLAGQGSAGHACELSRRAIFPLLPSDAGWLAGMCCEWKARAFQRGRYPQCHSNAPSVKLSHVSALLQPDYRLMVDRPAHEILRNHRVILTLWVVLMSASLGGMIDKVGGRSPPYVPGAVLPVGPLAYGRGVAACAQLCCCCWSLLRGAVVALQYRGQSGI